MGPNMKRFRGFIADSARIVSRYIVGAVIVGVMASSGCSTNPATGKKQFNLISESQEINIGKEADAEIVASMGLYPDDSMQKYIQNFGRKLAAASERPELPWTFRLIDDPVVNAFALPGGYIYVTRGILSHLANEAELAGVVGHEIGHVTAQHSVTQMSRQQIAQIGLVAGMIIKPELQQYSQLASMGLGLMFLKFSRDNESEADDLGLRYMQRVNYDVREMPGVFEMLSRVSSASGGGRMPEWLATHPDPENRKERIASQADAVKGGKANAMVNRDQYMSLLDNMVFGLNPREGFFRGNTFYQPDLKIRYEFPQGWKYINQKQAVIGVSKEQDAIVQITLVKQQSTEAAAREFFSQQGVNSSQVRSEQINGMTATSGVFAAQTEQGALQGTASFVSYNGNVYQILGYTGQQQWSQYQGPISSSIRSFDKLTDPKLLNVQPMRLKVVTLDRPMTIEQFAQQYGSPVSVETLALINRVDKGTQMRAGQKVKRVVGEKFD